MFLLKHFSGLGFWCIQPYPFDADFHLKRQILSMQPYCIPVSSFKKPIQHNIHLRLFPQWGGADTLLYNLVVSHYTHINTLTNTAPQRKKNTCTPTNPKRQNPGAKNNSLEWDGWRRTDYCGSNLWKADNKTHLKWLQRCYWHGGSLNAPYSSYPLLYLYWQCSLQHNSSCINTLVKVLHSDTWTEALMLMQGSWGERGKVNKMRW